jgi:hypothetical protein
VGAPIKERPSHERSQAPSKEAAIAVHKEGHGLLADQVIEVKEGK